MFYSRAQMQTYFSRSRNNDITRNKKLYGLFLFIKTYYSDYCMQMCAGIQTQYRHKGDPPSLVNHESLVQLSLITRSARDIKRRAREMVWVQESVSFRSHIHYYLLFHNLKSISVNQLVNTANPDRRRSVLTAVRSRSARA